MTNLRTSIAFAVLIASAGCDTDPICTPLVYDRNERRCVCPPGSEWIMDEAICVLPDGGMLHLPDDAGSRSADDACVPQAWYRDGDGDGHGDPLTRVDACEAPDRFVAAGDDCDDECETCAPGRAEECDGTRDENCVGGVDEGCDCATGRSRACPGGTDIGECAAGVQTCIDGAWSDCDGAIGVATEACNGLDEDCDMVIDGPAASAACGSRPRATSVACSGGACVVAACTTGFDDCDDDDANGCEAELAADESNCGACGNQCGWWCDGSDCVGIATPVAGSSITCLITDRSELACAGTNDAGALGVGDTRTFSSRPVFVVSPSATTRLTGVTQVSVGTQHVCAALSDGRVACWGSNLYGQLGPGAGAQQSRPYVVPGLSTAVEVVAGQQHSCARLASGGVRCWGNNEAGRLGDGTTTQRTTVATVLRSDGTPLTGVQRLSVGTAHTCAITSARTAWCWGSNFFGQLGDGTTTTRPSAVQVTGLSNVVQLESGSAFSCALDSFDRVRCWGDNVHGQLGDGSTTRRPAPVQASISDVEEIGTGSSHACARVSGGRVLCWGRNAFYELGDGTRTTQLAPVVAQFTNVEALVVGGARTCILDTAGRLWCVGINDRGQFGDGSVPNSDGTATPVRLIEP
ncbi:RCC1 domain-containing protein [Sandaracinus amylolyticus]|uniref:BNR repeat domain protein n=1 Tax=Sandaracinus amylolyticus TaxID=927083 RepID=A0A0F6YJM2_9BACT|nr:hypothetical protein [Sandaracinus amylolyticus]AKF08220.1 BNR repeat domain protein [Sandaracinus amylolyticus]